MNRFVKEDAINITKQFDMSVFNNKTVLVTGATGLIGSLCVRSMLASDYDIKVLALVRNEDKARKMFGENNNLELLVQDIQTPLAIGKHADYIIHTASTTASKDFVEKPVETILTAIKGTYNILEYAKKTACSSLVYLSSLEVYGIPTKENVTEKDYGYIEILTPRGSYPESKRMVENLCISYGSEYGVPVKIARLTQTFGAGVTKADNRVFAQFAKSVIDKKNIVLHTQGRTKRCYCYTTDAITAIYTVLTKGENNTAYNIANKNTYISICDMAKSLENDNTKVVFETDNENHGYNPEMQICLDTQKLEDLGWSAKTPLDEMFKRLICSMEEDDA
jgi:dTDP-glucose 4,6-dehydratase